MFYKVKYISNFTKMYTVHIPKYTFWKKWDVTDVPEEDKFRNVFMRLYWVLKASAKNLAPID